MKRIAAFTIIWMALTACIAPQTQPTPDPAATNMPPAGMPNPASVYCEQQGNKHEIRAANDGSQSGVCILQDGSSCDEWAYYRGECGTTVQTTPTTVTTIAATSDVTNDNTEGINPGSSMPPGAAEEVADWWGIIKSTGAGAQFDDYFERQDSGQSISFGIDSDDPVVQSQMKALCDSGEVVHIYGTLVSNVPDYNGSQIIVERLETEE